MLLASCLGSPAEHGVTATPAETTVVSTVQPTATFPPSPTPPPTPAAESVGSRFECVEPYLNPNAQIYSWEYNFVSGAAAERSSLRGRNPVPLFVGEEDCFKVKARSFIGPTRNITLEVFFSDNFVLIGGNSTYQGELHEGQDVEFVAVFRAQAPGAGEIGVRAYQNSALINDSAPPPFRFNITDASE